MSRLNPSPYVRLSEAKAGTVPFWRRPVPASLVAVVAVAGLFTMLLVIKSIVDFTHTGPAIRDEIAKHYGWYSAYVLVRLGAWAMLISLLLASVGAVAYGCLATWLGWRWRFGWALLAAAGGIGVGSTMQFVYQLLYLPGSITASFHYRVSRLYPLQELLTPERVTAMYIAVLLLVAIPVAGCLWSLVRRGAWRAVTGLMAVVVVLGASFLWSVWEPEPAPLVSPLAGSKARPNVLFIGSDTLRADRLGGTGYPRDLTPFIDHLASQGVRFANQFVPIARTAPSLASILTGTWPQYHDIRSNYVPDTDTVLPATPLPKVLERAGYRTAAVADWVGSDLAKLSFGFGVTQVPPDQWNLRYLLSQGPKDLRLFLSLFTHNRFGRLFLPEIHYIGGTPMDRMEGLEIRRMIRRLGAQVQPFFLFGFLSSTHPPFATTYPYYTLYSKPDYRGESRFAMSGLVDVRSIIESQGKGKDQFDYQQIIDLYDAGVRSFDDEVRRIVSYLDASGLREDTIIVIFSDHGTELFDGKTWGQGNSVLGDDPSARAPLVIVDPRRATDGVVVTRVTRSVDQMPTLLDLLGLPIPADVQGVSLVPYMDGGEADLGLTAYSETGLWLGPIAGMDEEHLRYPTLLDLLEVETPETGTLSLKPRYRNIVIAAKDRMVRTDRWKLVYQPLVSGARYQLFDLSVDPKAQHDVHEKYPEQLQEMKRKLARWLAKDRLRP